MIADFGKETQICQEKKSIIIYYNGFGEGSDIPPDRNDLPVSIPVGSQTLHAVGLAWAAKYRKTDRVAMAYFGDGGTSQGDFHEGLNFAGVFQAPAIFICQNNQWGISIPRSSHTGSETIAQKALAYGVPGIQVDGNDILATYAAAKEAVDRARSGGGPTLIECVTYRLAVHTTADDPRRYRTKEEIEKWKKRNPITRFQKYLVGKGLFSEDKIESIKSTVLEQIRAAVDKIMSSTGALAQADIPDKLLVLGGGYSTTRNRPLIGCWLPSDAVRPHRALASKIPKLSWTIRDL